MKMQVTRSASTYLDPMFGARVQDVFSESYHLAFQIEANLKSNTNKSKLWHM